MAESETKEVYKPTFRWEENRSYPSSKIKRTVRALLFGRFGQKNCFFCGRDLDPHLLHLAFAIHHKIMYGEVGCNYLVNLALAHHSCNTGKPLDPSVRNQTRDKDRIPPDATTSLRQVVDYSRGSAEMQVNGDAEPLYRAKMWELLDYGESQMKKARAIYGLAELIGVSPQATRDYYSKMVSEDGPFQEYKEKDTNVKMVRVKKDRLT